MSNGFHVRAHPCRFALFCITLLLSAFPLFSQPSLSAVNQNDEPFSFIGMRLDELVSRFGAPRSVNVSRGDELFQDDVVFAYNDIEFYIFRDRVWKLGLRSVFGMKTGDAKSAALQVLGNNAKDEGDYLLYDIPGGAWPVTMRVNITNNRISAIFIYRPDFL